MTIISSNEFFINQEKYFGMALNEQVFVQKGENMFAVSIANELQNECLEPDEDLRRAITAEELLKRIYADIDKKFESRIENECTVFA
jgi:hypothetical protein